MNARVTVLGSNSAAPTRNRNPSGQVLELDGKKVLIDCGEGTQKRLLLNGINFQKINYIFISHLHGDHYFGLMGLLNTMSLNQRSHKITIFGHPGLKQLHELIAKLGNTHFSFEIEFIELDAENTHTLNIPGWEVKVIPVSHRIPCFAFRFTQTQNHRKLNIEACVRLQIPVSVYGSITEGEDYVSPNGETIPNGELTFDPKPPVSYGYITDTVYRPDLAPLFEGCSTVYHEATYLHNLLDRAEMTGHSTALQAARFANQTSTNQLLIGHFSSRYEKTNELLAEAKQVFKNTFVAEEGKSFEIS